jgi:hypothetical protein
MQQTVPKLWVFLFSIIAVLVVAIVVTNPSPPTPPPEEFADPDPTRYSTFEQMLLVGDNAIYVDNQKSGMASVRVGFVVLSEPGYVVILDDDDGVPGSIIGESHLLLEGGEHVSIELDQTLEEAAVYYAMLYHDDGDGRFRASEDVQVVDSEESVVLMTFLASAQSEPESGPVLP